MNSRKDLDTELAAIERCTGADARRRYWRSLEELAGSEAFQEVMQREFPEQAADWGDGVSRRQFLALMGASLALAGLTGCSVKSAPSIRSQSEIPRLSTL